jgi:hypothetical protein
MNTDPVTVAPASPRQVSEQVTKSADRWLRSILNSAFDVNAVKLSIKRTHGVSVLVATAITGDGHEMKLGLAQRGDMLSLEHMLQELTGNIIPPNWDQARQYGHFTDPSDPRKLDTAEVSLESERDSCSFILKFQRNRSNR